jgi:hypothetical protein
MLGSSWVAAQLAASQEGLSSTKLVLLNHLLCRQMLQADCALSFPRYSVTLRVVVKEPVQVRTYTWCLQVPPRCTKYKVEMRDRIKIQVSCTQHPHICLPDQPQPWELPPLLLILRELTFPPGASSNYDVSETRYVSFFGGGQDKVCNITAWPLLLS